jgi:RNA polymerase sporulation-specific sigma factor
VLKEYLAELSQVKILSPNEEATLWEKFKKRQDFQARQRLIVAYQPLVYKTAAKINPNEQIIFDLIQEGTVGLIEAVEGFDPSLANRFSTYAVLRIKGRMLNYLARSRNIREVHGMGEDTNLAAFLEQYRDEQTDIEEMVTNQVLHHRVDDAIRRLSEREQQVIRDLIIYEKSPIQTASEMKISLSYLYKIQKKALQRLRGMLSRFKIDIKYDA